MGDFVIIAVVAVGLVLGVQATIKHMKGQGGCCGGGKVPKPAKKTLKGKKVGEKVVYIEGMHCDNCRAGVERQLNWIDEAAAKVNLKKKTAVVSMERLVGDEELKAAVEEAGFQVSKIKFKEA